jgi:c-di-GMP-binding flagellar brake protein YcgR
MAEAATLDRKSPLKIWDKIEITVGDDAGAGVYSTRIEDISQGILIAAKPHFVRGGRLLTAEAFVFIRFMRPDAMYQVSAKIRPLNGRKDGWVQLYSLGRIERVQRRDFVRIDKKIDLKYRLVKRKSADAKEYLCGGNADPGHRAYPAGRYSSVTGQ